MKATIILISLFSAAVGSAYQSEPGIRGSLVNTNNELSVGAPSFESDTSEVDIDERRVAALKSLDVGDDILVEGARLFGEEDYDEQRELRSCGSSQQLWKLEMTTDFYAFENEWELKKGDQVIVVNGPPPNHRYQDTTYYAGSMCLGEGTYTLVMKDSGNDGMCCTYGNGNYTSTADGTQIGDSDGSTDWSNREHTFVILGSPSPTSPPTAPPTTSPTLSPTSSPTTQPSSSPTPPPIPLVPRSLPIDCPLGQRSILVEVLVDRYGEETTWELRDVVGDQVMANDVVFAPNEKRSQQTCVSDGTYKFIVRDGAQDGICCKYDPGYYKVFVEEDDEWSNILSGGNFKTASITHTLVVGYVPPTGRDLEWLEAHNTRRKEAHEFYEKTYVPLKWSESLEEEARAYAEVQVVACDSIKSDKDNDYGENVAKMINGTAPPPEFVVRSFSDLEADKAWPNNKRRTQVLWRATKYLGCAEASRVTNNGLSNCYIQVCRYAKSGNCNMGGPKWLEKMLADDSGCEPICPPDGCY